MSTEFSIFPNILPPLPPTTPTPPTEVSAASFPGSLIIFPPSTSRSEKMESTASCPCSTFLKNLLKCCPKSQKVAQKLFQKYSRCFSYFLQEVVNCPTKEPFFTVPWAFKVAEHSFRARFCWCNSARAQGLQKTNMPSIERLFYLLNTRSICAIFLYNWTQRIDGFSLLLQRYVRKVTMQRTQQFSVFSFLPKEPS